MSTPINIAGEAIVVGPDDHLVMIFPAELDRDVLEGLALVMNARLGDRWVAINGPGATMAVIRGAADAPPEDLSAIAELWTHEGAVIADISPLPWRQLRS